MYPAGDDLYSPFWYIRDVDVLSAMHHDNIIGAGAQGPKIFKPLNNPRTYLIKNPKVF